MKAQAKTHSHTYTYSRLTSCSADPFFLPPPPPPPPPPLPMYTATRPRRTAALLLQPLVLGTTKACAVVAAVAAAAAAATNTRRRSEVERRRGCVGRGLFLWVWQLLESMAGCGWMPCPVFCSMNSAGSEILLAPLRKTKQRQVALALESSGLDLMMRPLVLNDGNDQRFRPLV